MSWCSGDQGWVKLYLHQGHGVGWKDGPSLVEKNESECIAEWSARQMYPKSCFVTYFQTFFWSFLGRIERGRSGGGGR